jgi:hypothetical protein
VLDNQAKRSFAQADVNTVIVLFSSPDDRRDWALEKTARFVMFKVPFEHILSPIIFDEIEAATDRKGTPEYHISPVGQNVLLEGGWDWPDDVSEEAKKRFGRTLKGSKYGGNKWGGKYLRAPDIYWTIMEKGKGKLIRLGNIATVQRGFTSGANSFFYLGHETIKRWNIEPHFLKPLLKGPKDITSYYMKIQNLNDYVFFCRAMRDKLSGTNALKYIQWGESQPVTVRQGTHKGVEVKGFHRLATIANRNPWYALPLPLETRIFMNKGVNDRHFVALTDKPTACDQQIYQVKAHPEIDDFLLGILLNSTMTALFAELIGRCNFGEGVLWLATFEVEQFWVIDPRLLRSTEVKQFLQKFEGIRTHKPLAIASEITKPERIMLDDLIFSTLCLTKGECKAIYEAVINLVEARMKKAGSLDPKDRQKRSKMGTDAED